MLKCIHTHTHTCSHPGSDLTSENGLRLGEKGSTPHKQVTSPGTFLPSAVLEIERGKDVQHTKYNKLLRRGFIFIYLFILLCCLVSFHLCLSFISLNSSNCRQQRIRIRNALWNCNKLRDLCFPTTLSTPRVASETSFLFKISVRYK